MNEIVLYSLQLKKKIMVYINHLPLEEKESFLLDFREFKATNELIINFIEVYFENFPFVVCILYLVF